MLINDIRSDCLCYLHSILFGARHGAWAPDPKGEIPASDVCHTRVSVPATPSVVLESAAWISSAGLLRG